MSVFSGITSQEKLGGVFGLSCYLLLSDRIKNFISEGWPNKNTPFFLAHGLDDDIVPHTFGELSSKAMKDLGLENIEFRSYPYVVRIQAIHLFPRLTYNYSDLPHSADPAEIEDLERFLGKVLPAETDSKTPAGL